MKMTKRENEVKKIEDRNSKKKAPKKHRVLKIIGFTTLACILFSIPMSAVNDIGKPSTDPDDYVKEYEVVAGPEEIAAKNAAENAKVEEEDTTDQNSDVIDQNNYSESTEAAKEAEQSSDPVETEETGTSEVHLYNGYPVADPSDKDAVMEAAKQWIDEGTIVEGSAFSAYDESLPVALNQIDLLEGYYDDMSDLYYYIENRTSEYLKQAVFFLYFWDNDGMPIMVMPGGNDALNGDQYAYPITATNLAPNESIIIDETSVIPYNEIGYIGAIPVAYETMEGQIWNNAYMSNFMEKSGCYVWEFRDAAQTAVFDFYK